MNDYVIFTDSGCDLAPETLAKWGVRSRSLTFSFDGGATAFTDEEMPVSAFYAKMREGAIAKTAAVNVSAFTEAFEEELEKGNDVLYLGFSSGLSTTFNSARIASEQLKEKYPDRKIIVVDTLAASAGQGLIVYLTVEEKKKGASIEEAAEFAKGLIPRMGIWFTVDDLQYLKRGGRVSPTAAFVGGVLGIKPVMHVDNEGKLIPMSKVRGRRAALQAMADQYGRLADLSVSAPVYISHGDCMGDVELLKKLLKEQHNADVEVVSDVGPVIGAHSGPGTLALFFVGKER